MKSECEVQMTKLEAKRLNTETPKVNIETQLKKAIDVLLRLDLCYQNGKIALKREIIGSIFPEKLTFDGKQHRNTRLNEVASTIYLISNESQSKKKWANIVETSLPTRVGPPGRFSNHFLSDLYLIADLANKNTKILRINLKY